MCGIAAKYAWYKDAPPVNTEALHRTVESMISRGPDGSGMWVGPDKRIGLAHRRLKIIDLSDAGCQPMISDDGSLVLSYNGEIFNYRELRTGLEQLGHRFKSQSDTEVILRLYEQKGEAMLRDLRGMFAFALWDGRRRGLLLARDPFGIKPLYFIQNSHGISAASQVKALLEDESIERNFDPAGHVGFFVWGHVPEPYTLYKDIRSVTPGSTLWFGENGQRRENQFCNISKEFQLAGSNTDGNSSKDSAEQLREHLLDSVRYHFVADVPVGIFLSSGLDSATLAALGSEVGRDLHTITLGFKEFQGTPEDETVLAEKIARHYNTNHQTIWVSSEDYQSNLLNLISNMDQPSIDGVNSYFVSLAASQAGIRVALSGLGGDELFGGYSSFSLVPKMVKYLRPFSSVPGVGRGFRWVSGPLTKQFCSPKIASLLEFGGTFGGAYLLRRGLFMPWELPRFLDGDFVREGWAELHTVQNLNALIEGISSSWHKISALELSCYMRSQLLRDSDWASMAHSVEVRVPFVDLKLLRFVNDLALRERPVTKLDMAKTPIKPLPLEVLSRPKTGFGIPVRSWLLEKGTTGGNMRGLRGWALYVYKQLINAPMDLNQYAV